MSIISTAQAVIAALKAGSAITDPHPQLHVEERTVIAGLQQAVSDNTAALTTLQNTVTALSLKVPVAFATEAAATAAGVAGQLAVGQLVIVG